MDLVGLLQEANVPTLAQGHHHCRPGWVQLHCPLCSGGSGWRLGLRVRGGYFSCWKCGKLNTWDVLAELLDVTPSKAGKILKELDLPDGVESIELDKRGKLVLPAGIEPMRAVHKRYLRNERELDPDEMAEVWGLQGIGRASKLAWRLFIPIHLQGKVVSWTTRSLDPKARLRYISAAPEEELLNHKHLLYGEDHCRHCIIVVEGPGDVWNIGKGAACTFGLVWSVQQIHQIAAYPVRVICFDNSPDAQRRAHRLADQLAPFPGTTYVVNLTTGSDPGSASRKEISKLRKRFLGDHNE